MLNDHSLARSQAFSDAAVMLRGLADYLDGGSDSPLEPTLPASDGEDERIGPVPCPNCVPDTPIATGANSDGYWVGCEGCGRATSRYPSRAEAFQAWNDGLRIPADEPVQPWDQVKAELGLDDEVPKRPHKCSGCGETERLYWTLGCAGCNWETSYHDTVEATLEEFREGPPLLCPKCGGGVAVEERIKDEAWSVGCRCCSWQEEWEMDSVEGAKAQHRELYGSKPKVPHTGQPCETFVPPPSGGITWVAPTELKSCTTCDNWSEINHIGGCPDVSCETHDEWIDAGRCCTEWCGKKPAKQPCETEPVLLPTEQPTCENCRHCKSIWWDAGMRDAKCSLDNHDHAVSYCCKRWKIKSPQPCETFGHDPEVPVTVCSGGCLDAVAEEKK